VTDHFGYSVSFLFFGAAAAVAFFVFFALMPETRDGQAMTSAREEAAAAGAPGE
jgi:predicted MFS family arabinose efflux permease